MTFIVYYSIYHRKLLNIPKVIHFKVIILLRWKDFHLAFTNLSIQVVERTLHVARAYRFKNTFYELLRAI